MRRRDRGQKMNNCAATDCVLTRNGGIAYRNAVTSANENTALETREHWPCMAMKAYQQHDQVCLHNEKAYHQAAGQN